MPRVLFTNFYFCSYKTKKEVPIVKREQNDDLLEDIKAERVTEVTDLPPCKKTDISRIPPILPFQKNVNSTADVDKVSLNLFLLFENKKKWKFFRFS